MKTVIIVMLVLSVLANLVGCGLKPATELPAEPEEPAIRLPIKETSEEPAEEPLPQAEPQSAEEPAAAPRYVLTLSVTAGGENEDAALTGTAEIAVTNASAIHPKQLQESIFPFVYLEAVSPGFDDSPALPLATSFDVRRAEAT